MTRPPSATFHFRATLPDAAAAARAAAELAAPMADFLRERGADAEDANAVRLAVEELLTNMGKFGRLSPDGPPVEVELSLEHDAGGPRLSLSDNGRPFDSTTPPAPDLDAPPEERPIGGLGLFLLARLFPEREYKRENGRNHSAWRRPRGTTRKA